nr:immunoglobulin heavy chain junction region [Homo sapiens]
ANEQPESRGHGR